MGRHQRRTSLIICLVTTGTLLIAGQTLFIGLLTVFPELLTIVGAACWVLAGLIAFQPKPETELRDVTRIQQEYTRLKGNNK